MTLELSMLAIIPGPTNFQMRLLVADIPSVRDDLLRLLASRYDTVFVSRTSEAISLLHKDQFDAIVCGVNFDDSRMVDLLRSCKANGMCKTIPFFCCSPYPTELSHEFSSSLEHVCKSLGAVCYLDSRDYDNIENFGDALRELLRQVCPPAP